MLHRLLNRYLVIFPFFTPHQIAYAVPQQVAALFEFFLHARPFAGWDVLAQGVDRLLTAHNPRADELSGFLFDDVDGVLDGRQSHIYPFKLD